MGLAIFGVVLGAVIALLMTMIQENLRKPDLGLRIHRPMDMHYPAEEGRPAKDARFLSLELFNRPLPKWARWMSRYAALQCHGTLTFHHLDGQNIFGRSMPIRWSGSLEPVPMTGFVGDQQMIILDPTRYNPSPRMDVYPGEAARLDIGARFDNEEECYGWSNLSYISNPRWRNPDWKLGKNRYLVRVVIVSAGEKCTGTYRLINDVPQRDFRLEPALSENNITE
jgi:hypothetical protein